MQHRVELIFEFIQLDSCHFDTVGDLFLGLLDPVVVLLRKEFKVLGVDVEIIISHLKTFFLGLVLLNEVGKGTSKVVNSLPNTVFLLFSQLEAHVLFSAELSLLD